MLDTPRGARKERAVRTGLPDIVLAGRGLHGGREARATLRGRPGPTTLDGEPVGAWHVVSAQRSTVVVQGGRRLATVEHLCAALGAYGLHAGIEVRVDGPELPLLDGGAAAWCDAVSSLGVPAEPPGLVVVRDAELEVGASRYAFRRSERVEVSVELETTDARLHRVAAWAGDAGDFRTRIAPARTFCFAHEVDELARAGLAAHVSPESVVVVGDEILAAGRAFEPDEPARHKLLDLVGDLFLYGGPPRGTVAVKRPGHAATHEAMRLALAQGIVARHTSPKVG